MSLRRYAKKEGNSERRRRQVKEDGRRDYIFASTRKNAAPPPIRDQLRSLSHFNLGEEVFLQTRAAPRNLGLTPLARPVMPAPLPALSRRKKNEAPLSFPPSTPLALHCLTDSHLLCSLPLSLSPSVPWSVLQQCPFVVTLEGHLPLQPARARWPSPLTRLRAAGGLRRDRSLRSLAPSSSSSSSSSSACCSEQ